MIVVIDNRDSFTWNLVHQVGEVRADVVVVPADAPDAVVRARAADAIILSPGPGAPAAALGTRRVIAETLGRIPILGVCLGHQCLALEFGARISRVAPCHGRATVIRHEGAPVFAGLPAEFLAMRYHSLAVEPASLSPEVVVTAWSDGVVMGLEFPLAVPAWGVQFHPESIGTPLGTQIMRNFLRVSHTHKLCTPG